MLGYSLLKYDLLKKLVVKKMALPDGGNNVNKLTKHWSLGLTWWYKGVLI